MEDLRIYGVSVKSASYVVDDFCLRQGNMRQSGIIQAYANLKWAWKDLFRYTLWDIKTAVLPVDCKHDTVHLPSDCERVINLSVVDKFGRLHPLGFNTDLNTTDIRCLKPKCSCKNCNGEDTLCSAIDAISATTSTVTIHDVAYTQTVLTRYNGSGAVQTQTTRPTWDEQQGKVVYDVIIETKCNLEVTDKGCIKITKPNMDLLRDNFGIGNFIDQWDAFGFSWGNQRAYRELIPTAKNYWGEWNYNTADREIIHIFGSEDRRHFGHTEEQEHEWRNNIRQVILTYQTNGETPSQEIYIPDYAVLAVQIGMVYMQKMLSPKVNEEDKKAAKYAFSAEKNRVFKYLNPVRMEDVAKLQQAPHRW
jgi:hypothetical protein